MNNKVNGGLENGGFRAAFRGSYVNSKSDVTSSFLRYHGLVSQKIAPVRVGVEFDEENSQLYTLDKDTIQDESFRWTWWQVFVSWS